jgi:hypothetical protein
MSAQQVTVDAGPVFRVDLAPAVFGLSRKAVEGKVYRGDWIEGREYHRAPDGSIWLDKAGVQKWVISGGRKG